MLRFGRTGSRASRRERRESPRYPVGEALAALGWWQGSEYRTCPAMILDLSHSGARIIASAARPEVGQSTWLCVAGDPPSEWIAARVVSAQKITGKSALARLAFLEPCPYEVFKRVVPGFRFLPGGPQVDSPAGREPTWP